MKDGSSDSRFLQHDFLYRFIIGDGADDVSAITERLMFALGFKSKLIGTQYLKEAIILRFETTNMVHAGLTAIIYPAIAQKLNSTVNRVERAIRNTINDCFDNGNLMALNDLTLCKVVSSAYPPTNGELLGSIVSWLQIERQQHHVH